MTIAEASKYGEILNELDALKDELEELIARENFASSVLNGLSKNSKVHDTTYKSVERIEEVREKICFKISELICEYELLDKKIENIEDPLDRKIIRLRHINRYSFEKIGDTLFYSGGTIKNKYYKIFRENNDVITL